MLSVAWKEVERRPEVRQMQAMLCADGVRTANEVEDEWKLFQTIVEEVLREGTYMFKERDGLMEGALDDAQLRAEDLKAAKRTLESRKHKTDRLTWKPVRGAAGPAVNSSDRHAQLRSDRCIARWHRVKQILTAKLEQRVRCLREKGRALTSPRNST